MKTRKFFQPAILCLLLAAGSTATLPQPPAFDPGTFAVDFSSRPEAPTPLTGQYPEEANGIDWASADWTTAGDPKTGNRYLVIDRRADQGSAQALSDYIALQGSPWNFDDPFEAQAWKDLRMRTSSVPLLNDEFYWPEGGIEVIRSAAPPVQACSGGARGPLGPQGDLWICVDEFEAFLRRWESTLGTDLVQTLGLGVMPRTLSYNPQSSNWMAMSPRDPEEWSAVMREVGRYLAEIGWDQPLIFFFGEYENLFYGKDHPLYDGTPDTPRARAEDYAELYILTQNALQEHLPQVKLAGASTGTYSRDFTRDLQQNPYALGIEDWLEALKKLDPAFEPSAVGWQGYYWYGLDGYGPGRLLEGADHIRGVLVGLGFREEIPQYLNGWNGTFGNSEAVDGAMPDEARLLKEAAHLTSSIIDLLEIGNGQRRIQSAFYYTWNLDGAAFSDYRCGFPYQSLVSTVHEEVDLGDSLGCNLPASNLECKRATYYAMEFLSDLRDGSFVGASFQGDSSQEVSALRVAAVKKDCATEIVVAHRDGAALPSFNLVAQGLSPSTSYTVTVNTIQPGDSLCATLVSRRDSVSTDQSGALVVPLSATGDGLMQILVQPEQTCVPTAVEDKNHSSTLPSQFSLEQNYPNPFNPSTVISFQLPVNSHVTLKVFDVNGREVATLVDGNLEAGKHVVTFAPRDWAGGLYFYKITVGNFSQTRKAVLMK